jgi:hypothetical protein
MPTEKDPTQELQTQVLDSFRKSQEAVIDGMRTWAETIQQLVPSTAQAAMPRTDQLPTPAEVVDSVFDFAAQLLNAQRELAHSVLGATTAVGERVQEETKKAAGTAKRSTKRRPPPCRTIAGPARPPRRGDARSPPRGVTSWSPWCRSPVPTMQAALPPEAAVSDLRPDRRRAIPAPCGAGIGGA